MKYKIAICVPYFGKVQDFFNVWAISASYNKDIDFLFFSDDVSAIEFCDQFTNFKTTFLSFNEMGDLIKSKIGPRCFLNKPYKLCDYKPAYGLIFSDFLKGYDFWGYCDVDLVFGQITNFITDEILDNYERIMTLGHFSLNKNDPKIISLFKQSLYNGYINFPHIYKKNACISVFDEIQFNHICHANGVKIFNSYDIYCDLHVVEKGFLNSKNKIISDYFVATLNKKGLFIHQYEDSKPIQQLYLHLQKRKMVVNITDSFNTLIIYPNCCENLLDRSVSDFFIWRHDEKYTVCKKQEIKKATNKIRVRRKIEHILFGTLRKKQK